MMKMRLKLIAEEILGLQDKTFKLPELPYKVTALKPTLKTLDVHYNKHHGGYVDKLNENIQGTKYDGMSLEKIIQRSYSDSHLPVYNNAAQHFNHTFFWNILSPDGGGKPKGPCLESIEKNFQSFQNFKDVIIEKGKNHFGSGWVWVIRNGSSLSVQDMHDANNPITQNQYPILVIDLWEHAYYLDYQNEREKYLTEIFNIIDWNNVSENFEGYKR
jgi:Fe-Mn family superoxide dismutase|tara:strand:- start:3670 stop:4317 length:648 start_codon:yes stop_codon:yes gene_type:complete